MEIKQITMKQLMEEVVHEVGFGPQKLLEFCKMSLDDGDKFFGINSKGTQYQVPIAEVAAYFAPKPEPPPPPPSSGPEVHPPATAQPSIKEPPKEKRVVKRKRKPRKKATG